MIIINFIIVTIALLPFAPFLFTKLCLQRALPSHLRKGGLVGDGIFFECVMSFAPLSTGLLLGLMVFFNHPNLNMYVALQFGLCLLMTIVTFLRLKGSINERIREIYDAFVLYVEKKMIPAGIIVFFVFVGLKWCFPNIVL